MVLCNPSFQGVRKSSVKCLKCCAGAWREKGKISLRAPSSCSTTWTSFKDKPESPHLGEHVYPQCSSLEVETVLAEQCLAHQKHKNKYLLMTQKNCLLINILSMHKLLLMVENTRTLIKWISLLSQSLRLLFPSSIVMGRLEIAKIWETLEMKARKKKLTKDKCYRQHVWQCGKVFDICLGRFPSYFFAWNNAMISRTQQ